MSKLKKEYLELTRLIERLHRRYLDVLRAELTRRGVKDINSVQALLLSNIGDDEISIRDLIERGYYQGSNVSYNVKKLTDFGYLTQERSLHDRRSVSIRLTDAAKDVVKIIRELEDHHTDALAEQETGADEFQEIRRVLLRMERTWTDYIHYGDR